jgi:small subunit ribosomal protein S6
MTIYPTEDEKYKNGLDTVRSVLSQFGAEIEKEEPYGDRDLTYVVNKQNRGRFLLLNIKANPSKIADIDKQFKLNTNLIKYLFVLKDEKEA